MSDVDPMKASAAQAAAALVEPGMCVGLGSGSTSSLMVEALGLRVREQGLVFSGVATSRQTADFAIARGIALLDLDECNSLDLSIDGADEVDPSFRMIKGRGGALLREKLVASVARRRITMVGPEKRVERLGVHMPIPVEVSPFGLKHVALKLRDLGAQTRLRLDPQGQPFVTDGGHRIIDCVFQTFKDPEILDANLHGIVGVFETGLFLGLCDLLIVGHGTRVEMIERMV